MPNGDEPTRDSDLRSEARDYHVIATAALPLMTGTAVNPLLRAAYLLRRNGELAREREGGKGGGPLGDMGEDVSCGSPEGIGDMGGVEPSAASPTSGDASVVPSFGGKEDGTHRRLTNDGVTSFESDDASDDAPQCGPVEGEDVEKGEDAGRMPCPPEMDEKFPAWTSTTACCTDPNDVRPSPMSSPARQTKTNEESQPCGSPCSLDYSCFSLSEIGTSNDLSAADGEGGGNRPRDVVVSPLASPLGDNDDSLLLSPFTPCEASPRISTLSSEDHFGTTGGASGASTVNGIKVSGRVTLVLPWLADADDLRALYGMERTNSSNEVVNFGGGGRIGTGFVVDDGLRGRGGAGGVRTIVAGGGGGHARRGAGAEHSVSIVGWVSCFDIVSPAHVSHIIATPPLGYYSLAHSKINRFYPAKYHGVYDSIFALVDVCDLIPGESRANPPTFASWRSRSI